MKRIFLYKVTVKQLVDDKDLDFEDRQDQPSGTYYIEGETENSALDEFHATVPISCLEDFEINITREMV